ncbi:MAG: response regulator [Alphaproteobacteria bacterium]|nr:response regulator [Alphaproteobacteria bacterium]
MARILVIDDDETVRFTMDYVLKSGGHEVGLAPNGKEGLRMQRETPFDLVITDIMMPEQDGIETIRTLKAEFPRLPIIAMSGGGQTNNLDYLEMARTFGAVAAIPKPFLPEALLQDVGLAALPAAPTRH